MAGEIPTPKWGQAPQDIRDAWHDHNNVQQRLVAQLEIAQDAISKMRMLMAELHNERTEVKLRH